ncbi:MAG: D-alanine--D-alanine ligase [Ruminococcaceae bacterium]|nr:D-alanine--D-alanine ligase [Oscillospiraceae bacterium]
MKTRVAVLFGGRSVEHEVSIITGVQAFLAVDRQKYDVIPLYLTKDNRFFTGENLGRVESYRDMDTCLKEATQVLLVAGENGVDMLRYPLKKFGNNIVGGFDVVIPAVHGTNVEDGTLMGYLELLGVPYAACDVTSSALGMDKYLMKAALKDAGVPVLDAVAFSGKDYAADADGVIAQVEQTIGYPVIVKPVNLGSSVGINKANDTAHLSAALDEAFSYASRVLVERAVPHLREINCSVLGDRDEAAASACEEPVGSDEILSFKDKYLAGGGKTATKSAGMSSLKRRCPAEIGDELTAKVQELAVKTFKALGCTGVARIDFLNNTETGELWVNEINTIPGSLSFYLWEAAGVSFAELTDRLVELAFRRQRQRDALSFDFTSNILSAVSLGGAKGTKGGKL